MPNIQNDQINTILEEIEGSKLKILERSKKRNIEKKKEKFLNEKKLLQLRIDKLSKWNCGGFINKYNKSIKLKQ